MSRRILAGLVLALALTASSTASAQIGGLVKKKAKEKAAEAAGVQQPSTDQAARLPGPEITPTVVDRLITALKAEKTARDRWAADEGKRQQAEEQRRKAKEERDKREARRKMDPQTRLQLCISDTMQADPDYAKLMKMSEEGNEAAKKGDNSAAMKAGMEMAPLQAAIHERAEKACAAAEKKESQQKKAGPEEEAIQEAPPQSPEAEGAKAGGFSEADYAQVKELVLVHIRTPKRAGLTDAEVKAVDPKRAQLTAGFKANGMM